jgi:L-alanine-DL-glutamate epimerase-like enolase superfamily enzyme
MPTPLPIRRSFVSSRRDFLRAGLAAGLGALAFPAGATQALAAGTSSRWMTIESIERTTLEVPYRETPARSMARELPHWKYTEIVEVKLKSGLTGIGETLLYYTWGVTQDDDVERVRGKNAIEVMWDDSLGAGLQSALFDAVARTLEVPIHALLGKKLYDRTPLSWWNIDTSPEDMALECQQIEQSTKVVPDEFKIDMDFNDTLLDAERAIPILQQFEDIPQVDIWEGPIPQKDLAGNRRIAEAMRAKVALHYGNPDPWLMLRENACDGFVVGGGAAKLLQIGAVCEMAKKPFWLQLVGTGLTAAYSLHFGGVLSQATWPAVNCHQLYTHSLLTEPLRVEQGKAAVPDKPGLGYELDRDAVAHFKISKPKARPEPERLIATTWADGRTLYIANNGQVNFMLTAANAGVYPFFEKGVKTRLVPDDGTAKWRELYQKARTKPFFG